MRSTKCIDFDYNVTKCLLVSFPKIQSTTSGSSQIISRNEFVKSHSYSHSRGTARVDIKGIALRRSGERNEDVDIHVRRVYARARPRMAFSFPLSIFFFSTWATWRRVLATGDSCRGLIGRCLARVWFKVFFRQRKEKRIRNMDETLEEELLVGERIPPVPGRTRSLFDSSLSSTIVTGLYSIFHGHWSRDIFGEYNLTIWNCF